VPRRGREPIGEFRMNPEHFFQEKFGLDVALYERLLGRSAVGTDLQFDEGVGTRGKGGQSVPVGVGMPTVRISPLTVGGTGV